jgi:hypothetical protein
MTVSGHNEPSNCRGTISDSSRGKKMSLDIPFHRTGYAALPHFTAHADGIPCPSQNSPNSPAG